MAKSFNVKGWWRVGAFGALAWIAAIASETAPLDAMANVAVVYPPWTRSADAISRAAAAGSAIVRAGALPFVVIVRPSRPTFMQAAWRNGAVAFLDASNVAGCIAKESRRP